MRTTLDIADDVLAAAKALAREHGRSAGDVLSDLARAGLGRPRSEKARNGVPLLKVKDSATRVSLELVNTLRDETP